VEILIQSLRIDEDRGRDLLKGMWVTVMVRLLFLLFAEETCYLPTTRSTNSRRAG